MYTGYNTSTEWMQHEDVTPQWMMDECHPPVNFTSNYWYDGVDVYYVNINNERVSVLGRSCQYPRVDNEDGRPVQCGEFESSPTL